MILGQGSKEPDVYVRPRHRPNPPQGAPVADRFGNAFPTMMVEVGFSQSLPDLHRTVARYFSPQTTIQIVLAIKIFGVCTNALANTSTHFT
jgi:hypothetical protein